jgi:hypothetical protein
MIGYDEALDIAKRFAEEVAGLFPDGVLAVFAVGSLGGGYYRPGRSDIDTVIIGNGRKGEPCSLRKEIRKIANRYQKEFNVPKGFGAIVMAEGQLYPPYVAKDELVLEILRLKTQSRLVYGDYDVGLIPMPDKRAIIEDARAFQAWVDGERAKRAGESVEPWDTARFVNSTLMYMKRYLMIKHGIIEFNKFKVVGLYLANGPPMVDDEVFGFIGEALANEGVTTDGAKMLRMMEWGAEMARVINDEVLYGHLEIG